MRDKLERFLEWTVVVLMAAMAAIVVAGVVFRKLGAPLVWYDETAPILLAWLTYYGACLAVLKRAHIGFPKLVESAGRRARLALRIVRETVIVSFFALAAWAGWKVWLVLEGTQLVSLPWVPAQLTQSVIPISSAVFIAAELLDFVEWHAGWTEEAR